MGIVYCSKARVLLIVCWNKYTQLTISLTWRIFVLKGISLWSYLTSLVQIGSVIAEIYLLLLMFLSCWCFLLLLSLLVHCCCYCCCWFQTPTFKVRSKLSQCEVFLGKNYIYAKIQYNKFFQNLKNFL